MYTKIYSATTIGVDAHIVEVEVDLSFGMIRFDIVGLPDAAIRESSKRITTALKNSGFRFPQKRITVNLAPAHIKKEGTLFDLPIAVGVLQAMEYVSIPPAVCQETIVIGELSLDGTIRPVKGVLAITYDAVKKLNKKRIIVPQANVFEAACIKNIEVIGVSTIQELVAYLRGELTIKPTTHSIEGITTNFISSLDFAEVKGQQFAKRALQIAAAGRHNILFIGSPGSGKTMLAKRLPSIMPSMTFDEILETSKIYSISGKLGTHHMITQRPFRSPHHTVSQAGLVGGGSFPQPGEISLAHHGVLFLDELPEFKRDTLEVLRQPLENKTVCISRTQQAVSFPASFLLVGALNPCPCGYLMDRRKQCTCSPTQIARYRDKLSGPLLDRIDLHVHVSSVEYETIATPTRDDPYSSRVLFEGVERAVRIQQQRAGTNDVVWNSNLSPALIEKYCPLTPNAQAILKKAFEKLNLSMRGYHKTLKIARTIADIMQQELIDVAHIQEAIMYRTFDHTERAQG